MKKETVKKISLKPLSFFLAALLVALILTTFEVVFIDKFFPNTYIGDINVTFLTKSQAYQVVLSKFDQRAKQKITLNYQDQNFDIDLATSSAKILSTDAIDQAFTIGHRGNLLIQLQDQFLLITLGKISTPTVNLNLDPQIINISNQVNKAPINATLKLVKDNQIEVSPSQPGIKLDTLQLKNEVINFLVLGSFNPNLPVKTVYPNASFTKTQKTKDILQTVNSEPISLTYNKSNWTIDQKTLFPLINIDQPGDLYLDKQKLADFVKSLAKDIDQPVVEALFNFDPNSKRVTAFKPAQVGQTLDQEKTTQLIILALNNQRPKNITLPVDTANPKIQTAEVNDLGINELLGRGISNFVGSIENRIYNVNLTAQKINGVLVPPAGVFSFNQTVGDITEETGFKKAYVIKEGRTVLDDGGGVCQDSTTLFRAVLNAGLPVVKRTAHAYRVGYYEQGFPVGLDATVFYPSVDFQFKNDTANHILIQAYTAGLTLYVDLYGTSDGRVAHITKSTITNQTPPPPELRQDDPTLPKGTVKQVDWSAWGAAVSFSRTVTKGSEKIIDEIFRSNYKAWQAIYLVGTGG